MYVYVSDNKVNQLYPKVPKTFREKIAAELGIGVPPLIVNLRGKNDPLATDETNRYRRLEIVTKDIRKNHSIGTIDEPNEYFEGTLDMRRGNYMETGMVFFAGKTNSTWLGLAGSAYHVYGRGGEGKGYPSHSLRPEIEMALKKEIGHEPIEPTQYYRRGGTRGGNHDFKLPNEENRDQTFLHMVVKVATRMEGPLEKLEFLARKLTYRDLLLPPRAKTDRMYSGGGYSWDKKRPYKRGEKVLLGTPIYVAG